MALTALHVTFIWNAYTADGADERMDLLKSEMETDLSVSIEDADLFNSIVGEDVLNMFDMFKLNPSTKDGTLTKRQCEDIVCFCTALAEVYLMVPIERQPTLTDTLFKTGVTSLFMSLMKAKCPSLPLSESMLMSTMQTSIATLLISMSTKKCEDDITRIEYTHQRLCRQFLPELQHMIYNSTCLATVLVMLKYSLMVGSTHKPFFREVFTEFSGVVEEFLKPGVLAAHWSRRIQGKQQALLKALTPYMPGEINCFVNIISWLIYEIPKRGMIEDDLDLVMARPSLLDSYWRLLNEPIPSTYFRFAKSKIMMLYSTLCEESPNYSKVLIEKYGVCPFLDQIVGENKIEAKSRFPLSCLVNNLIIAMNPMHEDCLFPMDQAMEKLYEDYGKNDPLIQSEILGYIPGIKKVAQNSISENLISLANDMAAAFDSDTKVKCDEIEKDSKDALDSNLAKTDITDKACKAPASWLQVYLEEKYGAEYPQYLPSYVNNGLYATHKRKMFYNCLEETNRSMLAAVCSHCNTSLNKQFCKDCYFPYCGVKCQNDDKDFHQYMGLFLSTLWEGFGQLVKGEEEWNLLMLGLDNAGKTTIVYKMKLNEVVQTIPTIGFNVETVTPTAGVKFTIWDVGGQETIRRLWRHYYHNCKGLIFVVDSNDPTRFNEAREELHNIVTAEEMPPRVPVIILANKQDLPHAQQPRVLVEKLNLQGLNNPWHIQAVTALSGDGIYESMDQLKVMLKAAHK